MKQLKIEDAEKFYKKLWWYKKSWFKTTEFESDIEDEELQEIITALNTKKRLKRIEYIYDTACKRIDSFYKGENICEFCNNQCLMQKNHDIKYINGCCRLCNNQSNKGCTTTNLSCKLHYCDLIRESKETLKFKDIKILKLLSLRQQIMCINNYFATKNQFLLDLKIGSIFFYAYHMLFRLIRNFYWVEFVNKKTQKKS